MHVKIQILRVGFVGGGLYFSLVWFDHTQGSQILLLAQCSGITPNVVQRTICGVEMEHSLALCIVSNQPAVLKLKFFSNQ